MLLCAFVQKHVIGDWDQKSGLSRSYNTPQLSFLCVKDHKLSRISHPYVKLYEAELMRTHATTFFRTVLCHILILRQTIRTVIRMSYTILSRYKHFCRRHSCTIKRCYFFIGDSFFFVPFESRSRTIDPSLV